MSKRTSLENVLNELKVYDSCEPIVTRKKLDRIERHMSSKINQSVRTIASAAASDDSYDTCLEFALSTSNLSFAAVEVESNISSLIRLIERLNNRNFDMLKILSYKAQSAIKVLKASAIDSEVTLLTSNDIDRDNLYVFEVMYKDASKAIELFERCESELSSSVERMRGLISYIDECPRYVSTAS